MDYEFQNIETLIRNAIDSTTDQSTAKEQFNQVRNAVAEESVRIRNTFALKVLSVEQDKVERLVRYHQQALINLLNNLVEVLSITNGSRSTIKESHFNDFVKFSCSAVEEILRFIQDHFKSHFDLDVHVPELIKERARKALKESSILLEANLSKFEIDPALLSICVSPMTDFLKEPDLKITYRKMNWIRELITELLQLSQDNAEGTVLTDQIQSIFILINYNHTTYLKYCTKIISSEVLVSETLAEKIEKFALHLKIVNQSLVRPDFAFNPNSSSLKEQLTDWVLEEIQFLERKQQLSIAHHSSAEDQVKQEFKLVFDMSVPQFAYFIRTLTEIGVIKSKNISELARFLAKFINTKRSENISSESFRKHYYDTEDRAKGTVRNLLHTAIGYIDNN